MILYIQFGGRYIFPPGLVHIGENNSNKEENTVAQIPISHHRLRLPILQIHRISEKNQ